MATPLFVSVLHVYVRYIIYSYLLSDHTIDLIKCEDQNPLNALRQRIPELEEISCWSASKTKLLDGTHGPCNASAVFTCNIAAPGAKDILKEKLQQLITTKSLHLQLFIPKERDDYECYFDEGPLRIVFPSFDDLKTGLRFVANLEIILASDYVSYREEEDCSAIYNYPEIENIAGIPEAPDYDDSDDADYDPESDNDSEEATSDYGSELDYDSEFDYISELDYDSEEPYIYDSSDILEFRHKSRQFARELEELYEIYEWEWEHEEESSSETEESHSKRCKWELLLDYMMGGGRPRLGEVEGEYYDHVDLGGRCVGGWRSR